MTSTTTATQDIPSRQQPVWHVIVLSIFSMTLYLPYWYYKTVRDLRGKALELEAQATAPPEPLASYREKHPLGAVGILLLPVAIGSSFIFFPPAPWLKLIGAAIPFFMLLMYGLLFRDIIKLSADENSNSGKHPALAAFGLTVGMVALWILSRCGGPFFLLFTLSCLPVALAQRFLNSYWKRNEPEEALVRQAFSPLEIVGIIIGSLYLALIVINFSIKK